MEKHNTYNVVATIYFQKFPIPKIISFPHVRKNTVHIVVISMSKIFFKSHRRAKD